MVPQAPASLTTIAKRANSRRCLAKTEEAIDLFIAHRKIASCDPLQPYGYLNIALSLIFKIARELSGEEVNNVVASTVARWDLARRKRSDGLGVCASRMRRSSARLRT
jgi:hypothetical protein